MLQVFVLRWLDFYLLHHRTHSPHLEPHAILVNIQRKSETNPHLCTGPETTSFVALHLSFHQIYIYIYISRYIRLPKPPKPGSFTGPSSKSSRSPGPHSTSRVFLKTPSLLGKELHWLEETQLPQAIHELLRPKRRKPREGRCFGVFF